MNKNVIKSTRKLATVILITWALTAMGCASVPQASVDLSYTLGQDLESLHQSHRQLVRSYFEALRTQVDDAIDHVFIPAYINNFVASGKLIQHAQGQRADLVEAWARLAVKRIDRERRERLQPLLEAERELINTIDLAFDKTVRANATITAQLNSVVKTQKAQDEMLESIKLKDLREQISSALAEASLKTGHITKDVASTTNKLEKLNN